MLKAIIIEDEKPAMEMLLHTLIETGIDVQVEAVLSSVAESIHYLSTRPKLILFSAMSSCRMVYHLKFSKTPIQIFRSSLLRL